MASEDLNPPTDAQELGRASADNDSFELSPGEEVTARILNVETVDTQYGENGVLTLELQETDKVVRWMCRGDAKAAFKNDELHRGAHIYLGKETEVQEYDGTEYHNVIIRKLDE